MPWLNEKVVAVAKIIAALVFFCPFGPGSPYSHFKTVSVLENVPITHGLSLRIWSLFNVGRSRIFGWGLSCVPGLTVANVWSDPLRVDRKRCEVRMPLGGEPGDRDDVAVEVGTKPELFLVRRGRGLGIVNDFKADLEAASGFEPLHRGFADLSLNHLGTPP